MILSMMDGRSLQSTFGPHASLSSNESLWSWGTRASGRRTNRTYLKHGEGTALVQTRTSGVKHFMAPDVRKKKT